MAARAAPLLSRLAAGKSAPPIREAMKGDYVMPTAITRDDVRALLARGAQLVDVLPTEEYADEHVQGAINLPLKTLTAASTAQLRRDRAVIVYCHDLQ